MSEKEVIMLSTNQKATQQNELSCQLNIYMK